jgi:polysaccharide biosynthesis PFTS motif protein
MKKVNVGQSRFLKMLCFEKKYKNIKLTNFKNYLINTSALLNQVKTKSTNTTTQLPQYKSFVKSGNLSKLRHLRESIMRFEIQKFSKSMDRDDLNRSLVFLQFIFDSRLAKKVFLRTGSRHRLSLPIPGDWIKIFSEFGYFINCRGSRCLFVVFLIKTALIEIAKSFYYLQYVLKKNFYNELKNRESILFHSSFSEKLIFSPDDKLANFGNWYAIRYHPGKQLLYLNNCSKFSILNPRYKTIFIKNYLLPLNFSNYCAFIVKSLVFVTISFLDYNFIKSLKFISLSDEILRIRFQHLDAKLLPSTVILSESSGYRYPSWLKFLEQQGVRVQFFNFSSSHSPSIKSDELVYQYPWPLLQYNEIKVIDEYQRDFLAKNLGNKLAEIEVTGVPFYTDFHYVMSPETGYICLFDIMFKSEGFGINTLNEIGANDLDVQQEILEIVIDYGLTRNVKICYKQKRDSNTEVFSPQTIGRIVEAQSKGLFEILDPRTSTHQIIKYSSAVISQAFTTTSIIAKQYNKPSFIVDLSNNLIATDPCLRSLPIITSKKDLHKSLDLIFDSFNSEEMI